MQSLEGEITKMRGGGGRRRNGNGAAVYTLTQMLFKS